MQACFFFSNSCFPVLKVFNVNTDGATGYRSLVYDNNQIPATMTVPPKWCYISTK